MTTGGNTGPRHTRIQRDKVHILKEVVLGPNGEIKHPIDIPCTTLKPPAGENCPVFEIAFLI